MKLLGLLIAALVVVGCEDSLKTQTDRLLDFFARYRIGDGADYGIFKTSIAGPRQHVVSVHGFANDQAQCLKLAARLNEAENGEPFYCDALNR